MDEVDVPVGMNQKVECQKYRSPTSTNTSEKFRPKSLFDRFGLSQVVPSLNKGI